MDTAYAGIDVAIRKGKPLPIVVCVLRDGVLEPLRLVDAAAKPPRGMGNAAALDDAERTRFAEKAAAYLHEIERELDVGIERIAIDAPSDPHNGECRVCEEKMRERDIRFFETPNQARFEAICAEARAHLEAGKPVSHLPASNLIWMLAGFALFQRLRDAGWECLEVFPHAISWKLEASGLSKKTPEGQRARLSAVSNYTRWPSTPEPHALDGIAYGDRHDRLDAYLAAWIASLPESQREAAGVAPNDVIWLPATREPQ